MIGRLIGIGTAARHVGQAVGGVAEVFVGNRAERDTHDHERYLRSVGQFSDEFRHPASGWFDQLVNGLNRLPRPMMAVGTLGLFTYAMVEPAGFATRMQGLAYVPEPLWWLLGAVVSFYFGARELHHYRGRKLELPPPPAFRDSDAAEAPVAALAAASGRAPRVAPLEASGRPQPRPGAPVATVAAAPAPAVAVDATDPDSNAAFEEWRRLAD